MKRLSPQLKKVRALLIQRRDALRASIAGDVTAMSRLKETVGDEIDAALDTVTCETSSQLAQVESRELREIEHALDRLAEGSYGKCEGCEKTIGAMRLTALPYATLCIACARRDERSVGGGARFTSAQFDEANELEDA